MRHQSNALNSPPTQTNFFYSGGLAILKALTAQAAELPERVVLAASSRQYRLTVEI